MAEGIVTDFPQHGGFQTAGVQGTQKISRGAAGIGGHSGVSVFVGTALGKINEQFAQCDHIHHAFASGYSVHSNR